MTESKQHLAIKNNTVNTFLDLGYSLISLDEITVDHYKPDLILENDYEVLFVEIVVSSDHHEDDVVSEYNGKPVRFIKYYSLDWFKYNRGKKQKGEFSILVVRIRQAMRDIIDEMVKLDTHTTVSEFVRDAIRQKIKQEAPHLISNLLKES